MTDGMDRSRAALGWYSLNSSKPRNGTLKGIYAHVFNLQFLLRRNPYYSTILLKKKLYINKKKR